MITSTKAASPRRTRAAAGCVALFVLYVLAMAAAFALGHGPTSRAMWAVAAVALAGSLLFAHRSGKTGPEGATGA